MPPSPTPRPQLSLLDRLIMPDPEGSRDRLPETDLRTLRTGITRDIEALLNARVRAVAPDEAYRELATSLPNHGMPDLTLLNLANEEGRKHAARLIEGVLRRCEPRLERVAVKVLGGGEPLDRTLRFRIDGVLKVGQARLTAVFDSKLEPASGRVAVGEPKIG